MLPSDLNEVPIITPEKALALLQKKGISITLKEAALIIELLYTLARIHYKQQHTQ
ncbi:hypothetical protein EDD80_109151 [Anseongella ginsenosidimutans]|uniref:Uncharacterized protein n=1 Tax=Anseongella ginsenosidimutans TaxID=496056 RepID=A0A4V2UTH2_9SPHI|nr:hypothetical protein [Anseongella ginsenosidimutans]TCS86119.1 hypothetical protein EDD80_109151 [Anseongella ginsenosidimutans]